MARQMTDIGLDSDEDLGAISGDFTVLDSTSQHQRQLVLNNKGDFKQNPSICVGAFDFLADENLQTLIRTISLEFTKDGMDVIGVSLSPEGVINSNAFYK